MQNGSLSDPEVSCLGRSTMCSGLSGGWSARNGQTVVSFKENKSQILISECLFSVSREVFGSIGIGHGKCSVLNP